MKAERFESGPVQISIRNVEGDMGEGTLMDLLISGDGDAILSLKAPEYSRGLQIQFNTMQGGSHNPIISRVLRRLARVLVDPSQEDKLFPFLPEA